MKWNPSKPGFIGNDNIYGVGIRAGYYTQALSIWVANWYAPQEAEYLHTLALLFLVSLFVGLCQLCSQPADAFAVEPFMLTSVAYYTLYMGLWDPSPPHLLPWEVLFRKRLAVDIMWLAFHGFDMWYWWAGVWKMKPSNGPLGTVIFYPYVGQTPLLGPEQWISIAARVINMIACTWLLVGLSCLCCYTWQQRRMDIMMPTERLKSLLEECMRAPDFHDASPDAAPSDAAPFDAPSRDKSEGDLVTAPGPRDSKQGSNSSSATTEKRDTTVSLERTFTGPPAYRRPTRTGTDLLKRGLLKWPTNGDTDFAQPPPDYVLYEPNIEAISQAAALLRETTSCPKQRSKLKGQKILECIFLPYLWVYEVLALLGHLPFHPLRPRILFAVCSHGRNLGYGRDLWYPVICRKVLKHPSYRTVSSRDLVLASRILLFSEPLEKTPNWLSYTLAFSTFGVCSVLIIGTELTIQWNGIKGVQNLSEVGQLIPFILGAAGLLKVIYAAMFEREKRDFEQFCRFEHCSAPKKREEWKFIGAQFRQCQEAHITQEIIPAPCEKDEEAVG